LYLSPTRAYSSALGRFFSRDPLGEEGGLNLYGYVENDPVNGVDPLGLFYREIFGALGGAIGFISSGGISIAVDAGTLGLNLAGTPLEVAAGTTGGYSAGSYVGSLLDQWLNNGGRLFTPAKLNTCPTRLDAEANQGKGPQHGGSQHEAAIQTILENLPTGAANIRKNQRQVDASGNQVGTNRPDVQFDLGGKHYNIEVDNDPNQAIRHLQNILRNDPNSNVELNF
jgi:uncharacterized protein RhaS with RHS repeats